MFNQPDDPRSDPPATEPARDWLGGDRRTRITPLDVRQARFKKVFRGFDPVEVTAFLTEVASDFEQVVRETERLRQEVVRVGAALQEHREHEKNLRNTLTSAQKVADDMRDTASGEAARIVHEAEGRAALLLDRAQARLEDVQREIDALRLKRRDVETSIESSISALRNTLDFVREQDARERDEEKLALHRPRPDPARAEELRTQLEEFRKQGADLRRTEA